MKEPKLCLKHSTNLDSDSLLDLIRQLVLELHPQRKHSLQVTMHSSLDRDLGFDSLSIVELLLRLENYFGIELPENLLSSAETPYDLWLAILSANGSHRQLRTSVMPVSVAEEMNTPPQSANTLTDILDWHLAQHADRPHVYLYGDIEQGQLITYANLADGAYRIASGLLEQGLSPGESVAIMLPTSRDYLFSFFGILLAGGVPVPIYPPFRPSQLEDHLYRHAKILANAEAVLMITVTKAKQVARLLSAHVPTLRNIVTPEQLSSTLGAYNNYPAKPDDTAFLQYTSGSTGQPKGVILTHENLVANIHAMGEAIRATPSDVFVSWLPLYHDMGLIGAWLGSLYYGMTLILMSPLAFLTRPSRWLRLIDKHQGTLTAAPNFAYELCLSKLKDSDLINLDLSSLRLAFNGAEPVRPNTLRRFQQRFEPYGFKSQAMAPVYGLAESAVGLAFPVPGCEPVIDRIQRGPFLAAGKVQQAQLSDNDALEFVSCGQPLPGYQIRIVDKTGHELPEGYQGRLEFKGPSATKGYFNNVKATQGLFDDTWLDTNDLAYIENGNVYLTSRVKDIIIHAGRNISPYEIEEAVGDIAGIRKGCVAVFGTPDPHTASERVVVVAEARENNSQTLEELQQQVQGIATDVLGMPPDDIVIAPPHTVLKTSSGKIRRAAVRERYEQGRLAEKPRAVWLQVLRLVSTSLWPQLSSLWQHSVKFSYAIYATFLFWLLVIPSWLLVILLPRDYWRWAVMRSSSRLLFALTRVPIRRQGFEKWSWDKPCIIVANHASYLDAVALVATLPCSVSFVAKAEFTKQFFANCFLRRINATFVERSDIHRIVGDVSQITDKAKAGHSLLFFPEGTFTRIPGLLPLHMGAFITAAQSGLPIIPITIKGTRSILRAGSWFPHHGAIDIIVDAPIVPAATDWTAAVALRNATRTVFVNNLGEPELSHLNATR